MLIPLGHIMKLIIVFKEKTIVLNGVFMYKNPMEKIKTIMDFMRYFNTDEKSIEYLDELKYGQKGWHCYRCNYTQYNYIPSRQKNAANGAGMRNQLPQTPSCEIHESL